MSLFALPDLSWRKMFGATAVVVLHIAIVALLLNATLVQRMFKPAPRETILLLRPLPKPQVNAPAKPVVPPVRKAAPVAKLQSSPRVTVPQTNAETPSADSRPGYQRFDCRAANLPKLTEEQRAECAKSAIGPKRGNDSDVDYADHSDQIPGAERWAREKARKNSPALLPCMSNRGITVPNPLCVAKGLVDGINPDEQADYSDKPDDTHIPNNGDPPPIYTDPDH